MINWKKTFELFGYSKTDKIPKKQKLVCQCDVCGKEKLSTKHYHYRSIKRSGEFRCRKCGNEKSKSKISESVKEKWKEKEYRNKQESKTHTREFKEKAREKAKNLWLDDDYILKYKNNFDPEIAKKNLKTAREKSRQISKEIMKNLWKDNSYRKKMESQSKEIWKEDTYRNNIIKNLKSHYENEEVLNKSSAKAKELWKDDEYRNKVTNKIKEKWKNEDYRIKMAKVLANRPKVSKLQEILYSVLDDLNITYYRERNDDADDLQCIVGPWSFDCCIPMKGQKYLLIDCHGDYYHSQEKQIHRDASKTTYISKYFSDMYDYKIIWGHEFKCKEKIIELIKYWTGKTQSELVEFSFGEIKIKKCKAKDYKLLLSKYHYLPNAGRGGISYGAYLNDMLVAVCIFSPLGRQNLPWDKNTTKELSRFCIHPRYQTENFASWFMSKCIKKLNTKYNTIISYCDTTFNHDGTIYKACNFRLDGKVKPDYWYVSEDGWVMHKKTLYNYAVKNSMTENDFSNKYKYKKVYGKEKLRFIYERGNA